MKVRVISIILVVLAVSLIAVPVYFIPHARANEYLSQTKADVKQLQGSFDKLAQTANGPLFERPDRPPAENIQLIHVAEASVDTTRTQLEKFNTTKSVLPSEDHIVLASKYAHAKVISAEVESMVAQTEDVLDEYEKLLAYLEAVSGVRALFEKNIHQINTYPDLNTLVGHQNITQSMEQELRIAASSLEKEQAPAQYKNSQTSLIATLTESANGFATLSQGLFAARDSTIYTGTAQIEAATTRYYAIDIDALYNTTISSPILNDVAELTEKLMQFE